MINLNSVNTSLEFLLSGSVTTTQLPFVVSYIGVSQEGTQHFNSANGASNNTTAVTILGAPVAGAKRNIQSVSIRNSDTTAKTVTVRLNDNATMRIIVTVTLAVGDHLLYTAASGWFVLDLSGFIKSISTADPLPVANGGTGVTSLTDGGVLIGNGTGVVQVTSAGTSGYLLTSTGAGSDPTFQAFPAASQAQQETGSSLLVGSAPGNQHYHQSAAKAWGRGNNAAGLSSSYNIASNTDTAAGRMTITFTTNMSSSTYTQVANIIGDFGGQTQGIAVSVVNDASSFEIRTHDPDTPWANADAGASFACYGDQ